MVVQGQSSRLSAQRHDEWRSADYDGGGPFGLQRNSTLGGVKQVDNLRPFSKDTTMFTASGVALQNRLTDLRNRRVTCTDRGAAMAEYGLLLALVALVAVGIMAAFGGEIVEVFTEAEASINSRADIPAAD